MQASGATILCAERVCGPLSLGQLVGGLRQRLFFQQRHPQLLMLEHADEDSALNAAADHLAAGIDPRRVALIVPARIPELAQLRDTLAGLPHGAPPALDTAALLAALRPGLVSPHAASAPEVAAANAVVRAVNAHAGGKVLHEAQPMLARRSPFAAPRVPLAAPVSDAAGLAATIEALPAGEALGLPAGETEGHPLFQLLEVFEHDLHFQDDLKAKFRRGGLSERVVKAHLLDCMEHALRPVRERRTALAADRPALAHVLEQGTARARAAACQALGQLRAVLPA
ncbi:hypothetical protein N8I74_06265 [Chitiniphilus purpureus]|uniref:Tryptophan--tRNA ligase n=1 Tax=Chitiniphilus purpureus TaxID=2981137 RepID=A0ABY6DQH6_9NEIS|nr:hypothetical protein [Chitiniphilus sp. CD1]UXY16619.1 hypothetical protein N8I74_06265 [Chitiniphilus sp. CD1]